MALTLDQGRDTACIDELRPGRVATGVRLLAQRCYHRLITPAGTLRGGEDEANFGLDLAGKIGSTAQADVGTSMPVQIQNELQKDPEVDSVQVVAERSTAAGRVSWTFTISVQSSAGPFDLVVAASDVSVELLGVR